MENETPKKIIFSGFQSPNFTPVPDEVFDFLIDYLSNAELKVLLYIIRRTFGFKKKTDNISFSQLCKGITTRDGHVLDRGTGLSKSTVALAVKTLLEKNIIVVQKNSSREKGFEPTTYALKFIDTPLSDIRTRVVQEIGQGLSYLPDIQETVLQDIKDNVNVELVKKEEKGDDNDNDGFDPDVNLIYQIIDYTGDNNPKSKGTFRKVIRGLGSGTTDQILAITKDAVRSGTVSKNKSAGYFIGVANNMAKERGIDLGFKNGDQQRQIGVAKLKAKVGNREAVSAMKFDRDDTD